MAKWFKWLRYLALLMIDGYGETDWPSAKCGYALRVWARTLIRI